VIAAGEIQKYVNPNIATLLAEVHQAICALSPESILLCSRQHPNTAPCWRASRQKKLHKIGRRTSSFLRNVAVRHGKSASYDVAGKVNEENHSSRRDEGK
jgi:hypothetical protein